MIFLLNERVQNTKITDCINDIIWSTISVVQYSVQNGINATPTLYVHCIFFWDFFFLLSPSHCVCDIHMVNRYNNIIYHSGNWPFLHSPKNLRLVLRALLQLFAHSDSVHFCSASLNSQHLNSQRLTVYSIRMAILRAFIVKYFGPERRKTFPRHKKCIEAFHEMPFTILVLGWAGWLWILVIFRSHLTKNPSWSNKLDIEKKEKNIFYGITIIIDKVFRFVNFKLSILTFYQHGHTIPSGSPI